MSKVKKVTILEKTMNARKGAGITEYGIIVGLVATVAIGSLVALGDRVDSIFTGTESTLSSGVAGTLVGGVDPQAFQNGYDQGFNEGFTAGQQDIIDQQVVDGTERFQAVNLPINNPSFEEGTGTTPDGWQRNNDIALREDGGVFGTGSGVPGAADGSFYMNGGNGSWDIVYQDIDVSAYATEIDTGGMIATQSMWMISIPNERGRFIMRMIDGSAGVTDVITSPYYQNQSGSWRKYVQTAVIPAGTRFIRIGFNPELNNSGSASQIFFDDFTFTLSR